MSQLHVELVNETVVEAVRVALDDHAASHHTSLGASALHGVITATEEEVIRRAVLTGLQNLRREHCTITCNNKHVANNRVLASSLHEGFCRLIHNTTALQGVVQRVAKRIQAHLSNSSQPGTRDLEAVASVYAAAPEVTQVLEAAVEEQLIWSGVDKNSEGDDMAAAATQVAGSTFFAAHWIWLSATLLFGYLIVRCVFGRMLSFSGTLNHRRRNRTVLIGLPDSGKTALFGQLVRHIQLRETRTSMRENIGPLLAAKEKGMAETAPGVTIVDCPGHPRLRERMLRAVGEAINVVVVIDTVTVQDSQHEGVAALAELLLTVLQSPEFYGVQRVLFACTKRDEVTSYAAKAVRKLLEAAMVASIESQQNTMGRVESVRDSNNAVITSRTRKSGRGGISGHRYVLSVEGGDEAAGVGAGGDITRSDLRGDGSVGGGLKKFSFDQLGIPIAFVDVSSRPHLTEHKYTVAPVEEFILDKLR